MIVILISLGLTFGIPGIYNLSYTRNQYIGLFLMMLSVTNIVFWVIDIGIKPLLNFKKNYNKAFAMSSLLLGIGQILQLYGG